MKSIQSRTAPPSATSARTGLDHRVPCVHTSHVTPDLFFFYGTLRPGQRNHLAILDGAPGVHHVGPGWTVERYTMLTGPGYPFVLPGPPVTRIRGDVFEVVSPRVVVALDELEGHTGDMRGYRREPVAIDLDGGQRLSCWTYLYHGMPRAHPVPGGDWLADNNRT